MLKSPFRSTFSQIFLGVTIASIISLLIAWGANYIRVMDTFAQFASRQVVIFQGNKDVYITEKLKLPPEYRDLFNAYRKTVEQQFVTSLFIGLGISLFAGALISIKITRPLSQLKEVIQKVTACGYKIQAPEKGPEEMRDLSHSFNRLISELSEQEENRQNLFADISHELNTPITKIRGQIEGMLDGVYPRNQATLNKIISNVTQMEFLIEALYQANRLNPQDVKLKLQKVKLLPIIETSVSGFTGKPINFVVKIDPKLTLLADKNRLTQIIDNLLSNAYKYTSQGEIKLEADKNKLVVKDSGIGIPPESLDHIFDRLYRVEKSRNREAGGLGLGLYIVKKLVSMHGWEIKVESQVNQGTTFTILFTQSS